jgi:flagellar hook-associated protein 3 FlgL
MTRIATAAQNDLILFYMQQNQSNLNDLNAEISTGQAAQTYSQIAPKATQLADFRTEASRQQGFMDTIDTLTTRLQTMDISLAQIQDLVSKFRAQLPNGAFNPTSPTVAQQAQQLLQQVAGFLNVQDGTRYLFGGTNGSTPPVDLSNLTTTLSLTAPVNGPPSSGGYYAGGPQLPPVKIDTQVSLNYGITANDAQTFEPIIRVLNYIANKGSFNPNVPADVTAATQAGQILDSALAALTNMRGNLGLQEAQLTSERTVHQNTLNVAENGVSNIVSVDQATAITQLQTLETQIQASYSATSQIQKLSLVNFING